MENTKVTTNNIDSRILDTSDKNIVDENLIKKIRKPKKSKVAKPKCDICGTTGDDVTFRIDPYQKDINNKIVKCFICDKCYANLCDDI